MNASAKEPQYPLEQVLEVKQERVRRAEKVVQEKKRALEVEEEKLKKVEEERDKVLNHHNAKLSQLRAKLDEGTTSPKIQQMKVYLEVVKENLKHEEEKVIKQKEQVHIAEQKLEEAKKELHLKRKEVEKLEVHREEWLKIEKKELTRKEEIQQDELGTTIYEAKRKKKERK